MPLTDEERKARRRESRKKYYAKTRDKVLEQNKKWREENRDKVREYAKRRYNENREEMLNRRRKYCEEHHDKVRECYKKWREENLEKCRERENRRHDERRGKELTKRRDFGYLPNKENNDTQLRRYTVHLINSYKTYLAATALEACEIAAQAFGWTRVAEPETNGNDYCRYVCFSARHDTFYITAKLKGDNP